MVRAGSGKRARSSITFDREVWDWLQANMKDRGINRYVNAAVQRSIEPPYQIEKPESFEEVTTSARTLLEGARERIIGVGHSLRHTIEGNEMLPRSKVEAGVDMTFIVMKYEMSEGDPPYWMLLRRLGGDEYVERAQETIRKHTDFLKELRELGPKHNSRIWLRHCDEVPLYGLVARDHNSTNAWMRVNIYARLQVKNPHPFIEINPSSPEGRQAYNVFYEYYEDLSGRASEIP